MLTALEWALEYVGRGWPVLPLYPIVGGKCSCPDRLYKVGPDPSKWKCSPGKHPFANLSHGVKDATLDPDRARLWWGSTMWPNAGVAIALAGAKLLDVAPDGVDDLADFIARGLPDTLTFRSGGGEGHQHFLYRLPDTAPRARLCLQQHYDILSEGYCVAPPTLHASGGTYTWLEYDTAREPTEPPPWSLELLVDQQNGRTPAATVSVPGEAILGINGEPPLDVDRDVWDGTNASDRSSGLWVIAGELAEAGANEATIVEALRERDQTLGWNKFTNRRDAETRYRETARRQLANVMPRIHLTGSVVMASTPTSTTIDNDPWPEPLEDVAFYGPLGEFVQAAARQSEASAEAILAMVISAVSAALHPATGGRAANAWHPIRISSVIVGPTAKGRKGTAGKIAEAVLLGADPDLREHIVDGLSSGEGVIWAIRDAIQKWDSKNKVWVTEDPGIDDKRVLVMESEFANVLRVLQREGNTLSAVLRRAWDLSPQGVLQMLTTGRRAVVARSTGAHVVIAGHITRDELLSYVDRTELVNGFANRFLWFAARRHQLLPFGEQVDPILIGNFASVVAAASTWSEAGHRMGWAAETRAAWDAAYRDLGSAGRGLHGAVVARGEPQVLRLGQLFAALDRTNQVTVAHLEAALAIWAYVDRTCHWVFGEILGNQQADDILLGLRTHGEMTRTDMRQWLGKNVSSASLTRALTLLQAAGLTSMEVRTTGGRPAEVWRPV